MSDNLPDKLSDNVGNKDRDKLGRFAPGNQIYGSRKGSPNKFNELKSEILDRGRKESIVSIWDEWLRSTNKRERYEACKIALQLMPREDKVEHEGGDVLIQKQIITTKCAKCGHDPEHCTPNPSHTNELEHGA